MNIYSFILNPVAYLYFFLLKACSIGCLLISNGECWKVFQFLFSCSPNSFDENKLLKFVSFDIIVLWDDFINPQGNKSRKTPCWCYHSSKFIEFVTTVLVLSSKIMETIIFLSIVDLSVVDVAVIAEDAVYHAPEPRY